MGRIICNVKGCSNEYEFIIGIHPDVSKFICEECAGKYLKKSVGKKEAPSWIGNGEKK